MIMLRAPSSFLAAGILFAIALLPGGSTGAQSDDHLAGLRLFLSEHDRFRLDKERSDEDSVIAPLADESPKPKPKPKPLPTPTPRIELQGFVARSDGENTLWINNRAVREGQSIGQNLRLISMDKNTGEVVIKMPNQSLIILQPGQRFGPESKNSSAPQNR